MRIKLVLAALLFLLPSNICGSKEDQKSNVESENLPQIDGSDGLVTEDDMTSRPAVKTVARREAAELTDGNDYNYYPLCGDKPMDSRITCYCGNRTLNGNADLSDGDYYCCVPPSAPGQAQSM